MTFKDLDAKMRVYEQSLDKTIPPGNYLLARIDGRGFTRLTKEVCQFKAPFDIKAQKDSITPTLPRPEQLPGRYAIWWK